MIIKLLVEGGAMKPGPAIAQKLGPLGINIGKLIQDINKETASFKGIKVPVLLDINTKTKEVKIQVQSPPLSELLKKEFSLEKGSPASHKIKVANAALEQLIQIAKTKQQGMLANSLKAALKSVIGTCASLGILVESKEPREVLKEIEAGQHDDLIEKQPALSEEKKAKLQADFEIIKKRQEEILKKEEAKAAKEATAAPAAPPEEAKAAEKKEEKTEAATEKVKEKRKL